MDHLEALRMQASEKYVLGELSPDVREQFEEHYFDCAECAEDVKAAFTFVRATREVLGEQAAPTTIVVKEPAVPSRWRSWFRPVVFVPAMAALVLSIGYLAWSPRPQVVEITEAGKGLVSSPAFGLRGGDRLENEKTVVQVHGQESFQLHFDFIPAQDHDFSSYIGEIQDRSARVLLQFAIPRDRINKEVDLVVPAGLLRSGEYTLAVFGREASTSPKTPVAKFAFAVHNEP
jgi:hypothetical protein